MSPNIETNFLFNPPSINSHYKKLRPAAHNFNFEKSDNIISRWLEGLLIIVTCKFSETVMQYLKEKDVVAGHPFVFIRAGKFKNSKNYTT